MLDFIFNNGVSIERSSLVTSLTDRYGRWNSPEARRGPGAPGVNFMSDRYVRGFTPLATIGSSDIRNIGRGSSGRSFVYGNEKRIPKTVSDSITTTHRAGPANSIQREFRAFAQTGITRFTGRGLNYIDSVYGFDNRRYWR